MIIMVRSLPFTNGLFIILLSSKGGNNHNIQLIKNVHREKPFKAYYGVKTENYLSRFLYRIFIEKSSHSDDHYG